MNILSYVFCKKKVKFSFEGEILQKKYVEMKEKLQKKYLPTKLVERDAVWC